MQSTSNNLVRFIILSIVFVTMFFGINVLSRMGYAIGGDENTGLQKILPTFYVVLLLTITYILSAVDRESFFAYRKKEFQFLFFIAIFMVFIYYNKLSGIGSFLPNTIILPILLSIVLKNSSSTFAKKVRNILIWFLIINSTIAITERLLSFHFFYPDIEKNLDNHGFRATALQNHPLNNALVTTIILSFIVISNMNYRVKYSLYVLGLISILCYGSRSSLMGSILILLIYEARKLFIKPKDLFSKLTRVIIPLFLFIVFFLVYYLITATPFGERLVTQGFFDEGADVRIQVFQVFNFVTPRDLMWGSSDSFIENVKSSAEINIIENFWLIWILRYGVFFTIALTYFLISFLKHLLASYSKFNNYFLIGIFFLIASTNISLASTTVAISVFVLCSYGFLEINNSKLNFARS